ncbi:MAG: HAMP domain-containing histidine kinase [Chloroflexi bacterium]|nr:HAMP domain-containing histidine kinase [Chloroflexota bacterium]
MCPYPYKPSKDKRWEKWQRFSHRRIGRDHKNRFLWMRFVGFFFFLSIPLLAVGGFVGAMYRAGIFTPERRPHSPMGILFCSVPFLTIALLSFIGSRAFRRLGTPLANVMNAADAVAEGDLSVRVPERGPSEFRRLSESFNRMVDELASADQQRRNMTADVAHELRTPIHILRGNLEGLLDGVYEATPEQIGSMLEEIRLLSRLVDDLQTISLAEAGQLPLNFEQVNIAELLADVQTSFSGQAEEKGVDLTVNVDDADLTVNADAGRLDQVLGNLVGNGLRYAPAETCLCLQAESSPEHVRLRIRDEGQGIPPEDIPFIFDRFYRADKSRARKEGGSGLGLAIAKQLIQLHGGTIKVESELEKGTTFTIDLPR